MSTDWTPTATCACGATFRRPEAYRWRRQCFACWQKSRPEQVDEADLERRVRYAEEECQQLRSQLQDERRANDAGLKAAAREVALCKKAVLELYAAATAEKLLTPDLLRDMILLCHPDRHGNGERANRVTAWLLDRRGDTSKL